MSDDRFHGKTLRCPLTRCQANLVHTDKNGVTHFDEVCSKCGYLVGTQLPVDPKPKK